MICYYYPVSGRGIVFNRFLCLYVCLFISFFVSLLARLWENSWTDLHEIFREGVEWPWDDLITFLVNSEKPCDAAMRNTGTGFVVLSHHSLFLVLFTLHDESVCCRYTQERSPMNAACVVSVSLVRLCWRGTVVSTPGSNPISAHSVVKSSDSRESSGLTWRDSTARRCPAYRWIPPRITTLVKVRFLWTFACLLT